MLSASFWEEGGRGSPGRSWDGGSLKRGAGKPSTASARKFPSPSVMELGEPIVAVGGLPWDMAEPPLGTRSREAPPLPRGLGSCLVVVKLRRTCHHLGNSGKTTTTALKVRTHPAGRSPAAVAVGRTGWVGWGLWLFTGLCKVCACVCAKMVLTWR